MSWVLSTAWARITRTGGISSAPADFDVSDQTSSISRSRCRSPTTVSDRASSLSCHRLSWYWEATHSWRRSASARDGSLSTSRRSKRAFLRPTWKSRSWMVRASLVRTSSARIPLRISRSSTVVSSARRGMSAGGIALPKTVAVSRTAASESCTASESGGVAESWTAAGPARLASAWDAARWARSVGGAASSARTIATQRPTVTGRAIVLSRTVTGRATGRATVRSRIVSESALGAGNAHLAGWTLSSRTAARASTESASILTNRRPLPHRERRRPVCVAGLHLPGLPPHVTA